MKSVSAKYAVLFGICSDICILYRNPYNPESLIFLYLIAYIPEVFFAVEKMCKRSLLLSRAGIPFMTCFGRGMPEPLDGYFVNKQKV
jgi:hypothetical protein